LENEKAAGVSRRPLSPASELVVVYPDNQPSGLSGHTLTSVAIMRLLPWCVALMEADGTAVFPDAAAVNPAQHGARGARVRYVVSNGVVTIALLPVERPNGYVGEQGPSLPLFIPSRRGGRVKLFISD
jgi:hypothetical protein